MLPLVVRSSRCTPPCAASSTTSANSCTCRRAAAAAATALVARSGRPEPRLFGCSRVSSGQAQGLSAWRLSVPAIYSLDHGRMPAESSPTACAQRNALCGTAGPLNRGHGTACSAAGVFNGGAERAAEGRLLVPRSPSHVRHGEYPAPPRLGTSPTLYIHLEVRSCHESDTVCLRLAPNLRQTAPLPLEDGVSIVCQKTRLSGEVTVAPCPQVFMFANDLLKLAR